MSWDVCFMKVPEGVTSIEQMSEAPGPLGSRDVLIARLCARLPGLDFSDPAWGRLDTDAFSIEFNIGDAPVVESLMLHVRGGGVVFGVIREVSEALGSPALDLSSGEFINFADPDAEAGFRAWQAFRAKVLEG